MIFVSMAVVIATQPSDPSDYLAPARAHAWVSNSFELGERALGTDGAHAYTLFITLK